MVESNIQDIQLRYFRLREDLVYAQLSTQLHKMKYEELIGATSEAKQQRSHEGRAIIFCLDKSGSMSGTPFKALQDGTLLIGRTLFENKIFEHVVVMFFQSSTSVTMCQNLAQFENVIRSNHAGGGTCFDPVFDAIQYQVLQQNPKINDVQIIFLTDGQGSETGSLNRIKEYMLKQEISSKFLTIGLSSSHDAVFLNRIAQSGSELGNFIYIDISQTGYAEQIQQSLADSMNMAAHVSEGLKLKISSKCMEFEDKVKLEKFVALKEEEKKEGDSEDLKMDIDQSNDVTYDFNAQQILREQALNDLEGALDVNGKEIPIKFAVTEVENPEPQVFTKAKIKLINKLIFDSIQEVQKQVGARTPKEICDYVEGLDKELDELMERCMMIKERQTKKDLIQDIHDCKQKTSQAMAVLRQSIGQGISNSQIAQLNNLAYQAVQSKGLQKKLDERAVKNEELFKENEKKVQDQLKKLQFKELGEKHKELVEFVGNCPLSCNNLIEALEAGDCMCLGLDIARTDACIADPTQLKIKDIIPTFMTADSFLDSAIFNLKKNNGANPDKINTTKEMAMGVGREKITGVIPLYLFKEHWNVARIRAQPVFGFLCTLDIMGYSSSQFFTIPFLVYLKALEKTQTENKEIFNKIAKLIEQTCINIMQSAEEFRKGIVKNIIEFHNNPASRLADVVSSLPLFLAQLYCLTRMENYQQYLGDFVLDKAKLEKIFRFAFEEQLRRNIKTNTDPPSKAALLKILFPENDKFVKEYTEKREKQIDQQIKDYMSATDDSLNQIYQEFSENLKNQKEIVEESKAEESKKEPAMPSSDAAYGNNLVNEVVQSKPWINYFNNKNYDIFKIMDAVKASFQRKQKSFFALVNLLGLNPEGKTITETAQLPLLNGDDEIMLALCLQNLQHPKNINRREAIQAGQYVEINSNSDAVNYLSQLVRTSLGAEVSIKEESFNKKLNSVKLNKTILSFNKAPTLEFAAAVMIQEVFYAGKGDRTKLIEEMLKKETVTPAVKDKLRLLQGVHFQGHRLFKDDYKKLHKDHISINHSLKFKIWVRLVRQKKVINTEEFLEVFPEMKGLAEVWEECLDVNGKPKKNGKAWRKFCDERAELHKKKKNENKAKANNAMKI